MQTDNSNSELKLIKPEFDSPLTDLIIDLEKLRTKVLSGTTNPSVFFQLKNIFHFLESIGSARIEGNNTTIAEYVENKIDGDQNVNEDIKEIHNIEEAINFVEESVISHKIDKSFISDIHKIIVKGLSNDKEGDRTPGSYRKTNLRINQSAHVPVDWIQVDSYMQELLDFINEDHPAKYDLIKVAIVHHRFLWIHPFGNGNGRTVRLITYATLVKSGFNVNIGRILNPTAIFCNDRELYYDRLSNGDANTEEGLLVWCEYVLKGLKEEIEKIDKLADYDFLRSNILMPSINFALERRMITDVEAKILKKVVEKQIIQASDIKYLFLEKADSEISRQIKKLIEKKMIVPVKENARKYQLRFDNNYLLRGIIKNLGEQGFLPVKDEQ
ncbi:MAG: Fic family protein [Mucilaginibacter sp.]|nr:Fic family protein [Mucilaginibacter sp.]